MTQPSAAKRGTKRRYFPRRRVCSFCVNHMEDIDYKDINLLRKYISERGKIEPRRKTGNCARHQRMVTTALKRARHIALLPFTPTYARPSGGGSLREK
ncbi:MAG: 30S ribosomal protein S18 [Chloroflexi bacterium RBG_13_54_9]|nr:MAG: 30S ribosomal protein S18 [Chloroflexi bacterium RBG_13_54_9]